jgi:LysR family transcriptional regulator of abg operon
MIKLQQLNAFLEISRAGSIRKAAEALGLAQPSLSRSLTLLERELGVRLLDRSVHGVSVTPAGRALLSKARLIEREVASIHQTFQPMASTLSGEVRIGVAPLFAIRYLPLFVDAFSARHPEVHPMVVDGLYPSIWNRIREGAIDAYFGPIPDRQRPPDLSFDRLFSSRMIVTVRKGHPLMRATSLTSLADARWVVAGLEEGPGRMVNQLFAAHGLPVPRPVASCESFIAMMALIGQSDMVGLLPETMLDSSAYDLMRVRIEERIPRPSQGVTTLARLAPHPAAAEFIRTFRDWILAQSTRRSHR